MVFLGYGAPDNITLINMSAQQTYYPEELYQKLVYERPCPHWIVVENQPIPLLTNDQRELACHITAAYHAGICGDGAESDAELL